MTGRRVDSTPIPLGPNLPGAACKGATEPLWDWTTDGETFVQRGLRLERAMAICRTCPVMARCLWTRETDPSLGPGVWGSQLFNTKAGVAVRHVTCCCGTRVVTMQPTQEYCSPKCKKAAELRRAREREVAA